MKVFSLILICICLKINAQIFNDLTQIGLNGKVKSIINYTYDTQYFDNKWNTVAISDKNNWKRHYEYHFLENGNLDSMYFETKIVSLKTPIITTRKYYYNSPKIIVQKGGLNYHIDSFKIIFLTDTSYQEENLDNKEVFHKNITTLNDKGRLKSTRYISYDSLNNKIQDEIIIYKINQKNICVKLITKDLITNKTKTDEFIILETDISENPKKTKVITTNYDGSKTQYLLKREYKYYDEINYFDYVNTLQDSFDAIYDKFSKTQIKKLDENEKLFSKIQLKKDSAKTIFQKAQLAQQISKQCCNYIQSIKDSALKYYTNVHYNNEFTFNLKLLKQNIINTYDELLAIVAIENQKEIRNIKKLNIEFIDEFNHSPLAGTMTLLTKFQNDIKSLEVDVLKELASMLK